MNMIVPDVGKLSMLDGITGFAATGSLATATLHLFTNPVTVNNATVIGDFVEAAWAGYAPQPLTAWGAAALVAGMGQSMPGVAAFGNTTGIGQSTFGVFILDALGNLLMAADTGVSPFLVPPGGTNAQVTAQDASLY